MVVLIVTFTVKEDSEVPQKKSINILLMLKVRNELLSCIWHLHSLSVDESQSKV